MHSATANPKQALRRQVGARLKAMTPADRAAASVQALSLIVRQPRWQKAVSVLFYAPMPGELDIWPLLGQALGAGKVMALPRFERAISGYVAYEVRDLARDIEAGHWGIREPVASCARQPLKRLDLVLVPGVAFDMHGRRLGRGKGYYDQLLAGVCGCRCGVAFDEQLVDAVPVEPHDAVMDCLLTPTRWVEL